MIFAYVHKLNLCDGKIYVFLSGLLIFPFLFNGIPGRLQNKI